MNQLVTHLLYDSGFQPIDEYIIMYNGTQNVDFNNIISLNSTAAHLWKHVEGMDFITHLLYDSGFQPILYQLFCIPLCGFRVYFIIFHTKCGFQ